jgi:hypothetical protein
MEFGHIFSLFLNTKKKQGNVRLYRRLQDFRARADQCCLSVKHKKMAIVQLPYLSACNSASFPFLATDFAVSARRNDM